MQNPSDNSSVIRIGVIDDHKIFVQPFAEMLNKLDRIQTTLVAYDGEHLLRLLNESSEKPHILLMDVDMEPMDGIEATRYVTTLYPDIKVIALSQRDEDSIMNRMVAAGACGYLRKDAEPEVLIECLYEIYEKGKYHADLYHIYEKQLQKSEFKADNIVFTPKQIELLNCMLEECNSEEAASKMHVSVAWIEKHKAIVGEKLNARRQTVIVIKALRMGILKVEEKKRWK